MQSGSGKFLDGVTSARHEVTVDLAAAGVQIRDTSGKLLALWAYDCIERVSGPEGVLRIALADNPVLARLEVPDGDLASAIDSYAARIDRSGRAERRMRRKVVVWSIAAVISVVLVAVYGLPAIATGLAPLVPYRVERAFGDAVDAQIRVLLDTRKRGADFECGRADSEKDGAAALQKLMQMLEAAADVPLPINAKVVRRRDANAFALPGGRIYIFQGLLDRADTPDELAGVIAHEIGHVAHRDGTRNVLQAAGLSFFFGMLLGDFVGGGAVIMASKTLLQVSYSREVEAAADAYSVDLMTDVAGDPHALATILKRIADDGDDLGWVKLLLDHPETRDRIAAITGTKRTSTRPLLDPAQWTALKQICSGP